VRPVALLAALAVWLAAAGGGATAPGATACPPTLDDGSGPFGRAAPPRRARIGTGHVLTGVVLSSVGCRPIRGAQVQLWQANRRGEYLRAGSATVVTDRDGRFRLEGPKPVSYGGRPPHIHLRVVAAEHELLFTRYVPRTRTTARGHIRLVLRPQRL
jgi:catechol 1,2-dioxygenase